MKEMVTKIPMNSCPVCGGRKYVVYEMYSEMHLTDDSGVVTDSKELIYKCNGYCRNCETKFDMTYGSMGFVPLTPVRKVLLENGGLDIEMDIIENPMEECI